MTVTEAAEVTDLAAAMRSIPDGAHLALTGFAITRNAVAAAHELIRAGRRNLTVTQVIGGIETDLLVGAGCVDRLLCSGGSLDRFGPLHAVNRAITDGSLTASEYSSLALTLRLEAGSLGLPYVPCRSMLGSHLLDRLLETDADAVALGRDPFSGGPGEPGEPVVLLRALRPDVAVVHVDEADEAGNAVVSGPTWSLRETALAARRVVVVCERVVPAGSLDPDRVVLPGMVVDAVVPVPGAAHPTAVHRAYDYDRAHLESYVAASGAGPAAHGEYIDRYVRGVDDHAGYLAAVGWAA